MVNAAPVELVGQRYALHEPLGTGGMGSVYRATDRLTGDVVALKRIPAASGKHADGAGLRLALTREFQTLASLRHPNVVGVLDYGFDDARQPYFTMTLIEHAVSLRVAGWNKPVADRVRLVIQVLQALVYLHRRGIVHRDLKPDNALVTPDGRVKVLDFGLAIARNQVRDDQYAGTLRYMAPEVIQGKTPDEAADLYSVGVMAYELLTGRHPFDGATPQELLTNVLRTEPDMDRLEAMLSSDPRDIPQLAGAVTETDLAFRLAHASTQRRLSLASQLFRAPVAEVALDEADDDYLSTRVFEAATLAEFRAMPEPTAGTEEGGHPLVAIIRTLMAKRPEDRYRDASRVIAALREALGEPVNQESSEIRESFLQAARFVGREAELNQLGFALEEAVCGRGGVWLVGGESGVGKSRLVDEVRTLAMVQGALVLRGQAVSEGGSLHHFWRDPLRRLLLSVPVDDADAAVLKPAVPDIERLLMRAVPDGAPDAGGPRRLEAILGDLFERYCARYPEGLLLILEDLQWAPGVAVALNALAERVARLPVLIVGTYRVEEAPDLPGQVPAARRLVLRRLTDRSIVALSESMLGEAGRQPHVVEFLRRETEGNAFFVVEVARALAEDAGQLERVGQAPLPERALSGGIRAILRRRLERIPPAYRPLLDLAAVYGRQLDLRVLAPLAEPVNLDVWLTACANGAIVDTQDGRWRFAHDKLREQVLAELDPFTRRSLHRRVAEATESVYGDTLVLRAPLLAYQWSYAGNKAKEFFYNRLAGEQAVDVRAYAEARDYYQNALALLVGGSDAADPAHEIDLRLKLAEVLQALGMYDSAVENFEAALALARAHQQPTALAAALLGLAWADLRQGNLQAARARAADVLAALPANAAPVLQANAYYLAGLIPLIEGRYREAHGHLSACVPFARALPDCSQLANVLNALGAAAEGLRQYDEARALLAEALEIAGRLGNRALAANARGNLGRVDYNAGRYASARAHFEQAFTAFRATGNAYGEANALYFLGFIAIASGEDAEAIRFLYDAIRRSMRVGAVTVTLIALCGVARLFARRGARERAVELLGMVLSHAAGAADVDVEKEGIPMLNQLGEELDPGAFEAALARGQTRELESVLDDLLMLKQDAAR